MLLMICGALAMGSGGNRIDIQRVRAEAGMQRVGVHGAVDAAQTADAIQREAEARAGSAESRR